jgi:low affinity Fe/Cu permease
MYDWIIELHKWLDFMNNWIAQMIGFHVWLITQMIGFHVWLITQMIGFHE